MKQIPVVLNFDSAKPIGFMEIDESKLPEGMDYVFSLACMVEKNKAELIMVSLLSDDQYIAYLKHIGKL